MSNFGMFPNNNLQAMIYLQNLKNMQDMQNIQNMQYMMYMQSLNNMKNIQNQAMAQSTGPKTPKVNLTFKTTQGVITNIPIDHGTSVGECLILYLKRMGQGGLISGNELSNKICFLYNANSLSINDTRKVEEVFTTAALSTIIVNDTSNVIGA